MSDIQILDVVTYDDHITKVLELESEIADYKHMENEFHNLIDKVESLEKKLNWKCMGISLRDYNKIAVMAITEMLESCGHGYKNSSNEVVVNRVELEIHMDKLERGE